jgi:hypothetical protein
MENFFYRKNWFDDLCEYYNVTPDVALELGTRKPNRKPNLPSSLTTHAVNNLTFEEIWASKPRDNEEQIFEFYKDQGAWSSFRQVVRHKDMTSTHVDFLTKTIKKNSTFCEYGCGVAPFTYTLLENIDISEKLNIYISDVESEHFTFGIWRLNKLIQTRNLNNVTFKPVVVLPNSLPRYPEKLDTVFIFEVLEHVPSPISTSNNLFSQMNSGGFFCENFIKHVHDPNEPPGPDLDSAAGQRHDYYKNLINNFELLTGGNPYDQPNETRIWKKK